MVPANGMCHKFKKELKNDVALLFGLIFLGYLDIGGEYFSLLFPLFAFYVYFILSSCFGCVVLKNNSGTSNFVNL